MRWLGAILAAVRQDFTGFKSQTHPEVTLNYLKRQILDLALGLESGEVSHTDVANWLLSTAAEFLEEEE